jgi:hypothetical protein
VGSDMCIRERNPTAHSSTRSVCYRAFGDMVGGTGTDYDMAKTVPIKAGSFVKHAAGGIHFDGQG